jgi:cell division septum initiation protein DivIVA
MKWGVLAASLAASAATASEVTPVQKVIQLLNGMMEKGKKEKHEEQVTFAAYKQFCDDTAVEKQRAIEEANQRIEKLNADIQKAEADAAQLGREIAQHDKDIATFEGDKAAATKVRQIEEEDYRATHKDYAESIDALGRAIAVMKEQDKDRAQAAFLQVQSKVLSAQNAVITAFLAEDPEMSLLSQAPQAHGYEFQSGGVVEMLQKLADKFADEQSALEKKEVNAKHAYDMLMQDLTAQIEHNTQARTEKSEAKGQKLQAAADAKGDLADTTATRDDDSKYLSDLTATCEQKASDFENRQQLRADEITAIEKAIEILSSGSVSGAADKHLPALVQTSFLQVKSASQALNVNQIKAVEYLKTRGSQINSKVLMQLASQMGTGADPFKKVKKLIQDLIVRLMEQANEEAEQKGWCDTELATNEATRKEKTKAVEKLHAEIDQLEASIAKLTEDIAELSAAVAALDKAVAEATKIREEEKAKNTQTVKDAKEAQAATAQALQVLKEFYAKAGEATSLLQQQPEAPEIFDSPYQGMQAENGGVVGMLEVIESDFARLEADTSAAETQSQKEYDQFMTDSQVDKAQKSKDIEHKTAKKQNEEQALQEKKGDLEGTQKELDSALNYFDKLKPQCIDSGVSYEERVARREEEVQSLQEALRILNGEDI